MLMTDSLKSAQSRSIEALGVASAGKASAYSCKSCLLRPESESSDSGIGIAAVPNSGKACLKSECCADSRDRYIGARHF